MMLDDRFLACPLAHRALHDNAEGRPENSRAAIQAAVDAGFGIEIDLQLSADGQAMVFHDDALDRLTPETGPVRARSAADLSQIVLRGTASETIPTLPEILALIDSRVPLLIEIKDQDGQMGPNIGALETATAAALSDYQGPVAVMSFNPHAVAEMARLAPQIPRGLTTCGYPPADWPDLPADTRDHLRRMADFDRTGACFVSHNHRHLTTPALQRLHADGVPILCWTIRSPVEEAQARKIADNITFEGYLA